MSVPECLVLGEVADRGSGLGERGRRCGWCGGLRALERTLDGRVRETLGRQQAATDGLDRGARMAARETGESVEGPLAGAAEPGEEGLGEGGRLGADVLGFAQQAGRLARRLVEPIATF